MRKYLSFVLTASFIWAPFLEATSSQRTDLPITAYDGGIFSAETLGRGGTAASSISSLGAGSSAPAGLSGSKESSLYTSVLVGLSTVRPHSAIASLDPTGQKTLQNLALGSDKGVLFYEPLGRRDADETSSLQALSANRHVEFAADALGFAASDKWRDGSVGLSLAYLNANLGEVFTSSSATQSDFDRGYGLRMNLSLRHPTGPFMWGLQLQNFPGFLWWNDHRRDLLPVRVRIGNTWRIQPGILFSIDTEKRFYKEGSIEKNFVYMGTESVISTQATLRVGVFSDDIGQPEKRHWTGGLTWKSSSGVEISYALERYIDLNESVKQSVLSVKMPLAMDSE